MVCCCCDHSCVCIKISSNSSGFTVKFVGTSRIYSCSFDLVMAQMLKLKSAVTMGADRIGVESWYIPQSTVILSVLPISSQIHIRYRH